MKKKLIAVVLSIMALAGVSTPSLAVDQAITHCGTNCPFPEPDPGSIKDVISNQNGKNAMIGLELECQGIAGGGPSARARLWWSQIQDTDASRIDIIRLDLWHKVVGEPWVVREWVPYSEGGLRYFPGAGGGWLDLWSDAHPTHLYGSDQWHAAAKFRIQWINGNWADQVFEISTDKVQDEDCP